MNNKMMMSRKGIAMVLALLIVLGMTFSSAFISARAENSGRSTTTVKILNSSGIEQPAGTALQPEWKLQINMSISDPAVDDEYKVELPAVFLGLSQTVLETNLYQNGLTEDDVTLALSNVSGAQTVTLTFLKDKLAANFSFHATLVATITEEEEHKIITSDGEYSFTVIPKQADTRGVPNAQKTTVSPYFYKDSDTPAISEAQFHVTNGDGFKYIFRINRNILKDVNYIGTIADTLPEGQFVQFPTFQQIAGSSVEQAYNEAYKSVSLNLYDTCVVKDENDGSLTFDLTKVSYTSHALNTLLNFIKRDFPSITSSDVDWTAVQLPQQLGESTFASNWLNADGTVISFSEIALGYQVYQDNNNHDRVRLSGIFGDIPYTDWTPLRDNGGSVTYTVPYSSISVQSINTVSTASGWTRTQVPSPTQYPLPGGSSATPTAGQLLYQWDYYYTGITGPVYSTYVLHDATNPDAARDTVYIKIHQTDGTPIQNKAFRAAVSVKFDTESYSIPSDGKLTFTNTAQYDKLESEKKNTYTYNLGNAGAMIDATGKTVDGQSLTYIDPQSETIAPLQYAIQFIKQGASNIAQGTLTAYDILDSHLTFKPGTLAVQIPDGAGGWTTISQAVDANTVSTTGTDGVNLTAAYSNGRITISNPDADISYNDTIQVIFQATVKAETPYGTEIGNYFYGKEVKTYIDNALEIVKRDTSGNAITTGSAEFKVSYATTYNNGEAATAPLKDAAGANVPNLITSTSSGAASAFYRLNASVFYLKVEEVSAPNEYIKIDAPIWIKAERDSITKTINYTLLTQIEGVSMSVDTNGKLIIAVENPSDTPATASITLTGQKTTNKNGSFSFSVMEGEDEVATGAATSTGAITFTEIDYTADDIGTHTYIITENALGGGWTQSNPVTIEVTVSTDTQNGGIKAEITSTTKTADFTNTYAAAGSLTLTGKKDISGTGATLTASQFDFAVYEGATRVATGTNDALGNITFTAIPYTAAGSHTYTVKETSVSGGGWTVDTTEYTVEVTVTDNGNGTLSTDKTITKGTDTVTQISFTNTYTQPTTQVILTASKEGVNKNPANGQFGFAVIENSKVVAVAANAGNGVVTFPAITYNAAGTHIYTIVETGFASDGLWTVGQDAGTAPVNKDNWRFDTAPKTVTVSVTRNFDNSLTANPTYPIGGTVFTNTFTVTPGSLVISATKNTTGRSLTAGVFGFALVENNKVVATAVNNADGSVTFDAISYTSKGTHTYTIMESGLYADGLWIVGQAPGTTPNTRENGWSFDTAIKTVTVVVEEDNAGLLTATPAYTGGSATFTNAYTADATSIALTATKALTGRTLKADEFSFQVKENGTVVATGKNDATGKITFSSIPYTSAGNHTYEITEVSGSLAGVTYDTGKKITVTVAVTDDGAGKLVATPTYPSDVIFRNSYGASKASIVLQATKKVDGNGTLIGGQFNFAVMEGTSVVATGTNSSKGDIVFSAIEYPSAGTHTYTVVETTIGTTMWATDDTEHTVTVTVADNGDGTLKATAVYPNGGITFTNKYTPPTNSGDGRFTMRLSKKLIGTDGLPAGNGKKFAVRLYDSDKNLIQRIILTANGDEVVITDLNSGTDYYLAEELGDGFEIDGYEVDGYGLLKAKAVGFRVPKVSSGTIEVKAVVRNLVVDLDEIPSDIPPNKSQDPPDDDTEIIDVPKKNNSSNQSTSTISNSSTGKGTGNDDDADIPITGGKMMMLATMTILLAGLVGCAIFILPRRRYRRR